MPAFQGLLVALIASWLRDTDVRRAAGIGASAALVLHLITPAGVPVLLGAGIGFSATVLLMRREGRLGADPSVAVDTATTVAGASVAGTDDDVQGVDA